MKNKAIMNELEWPYNFVFDAFNYEKLDKFKEDLDNYFVEDLESAVELALSIKIGFRFMKNPSNLEILHMRYKDKMKYTEIADIKHTTKERIRTVLCRYFDVLNQFDRKKHLLR